MVVRRGEMERSGETMSLSSSSLSSSRQFTQCRHRSSSSSSLDWEVRSSSWRESKTAL